MGDALVALASSGLHTNGYSLARRVVFDRMGSRPTTSFPARARRRRGAARAHRSYLHALEPLLAQGAVHGLAHITGGGLVENLPRVLPAGTAARIERASWEVPTVFRVLQQEGGIDDAEMFRAFNMGVGMVAVVPAEGADALVAELNRAGENAWIAGRIVAGAGDVQLL